MQPPCIIRSFRWVLVFALLFTLNLSANESDPQWPAYLDQIKKELSLGGTAVFDGSDLSAFRFITENGQADSSFVPVTGQPFSRALRVKVFGTTQQIYAVQLLSPQTTVSLKKGDHLLFILNARCLESPPGGMGRFNAILQASQDPWTGIASESVAISQEWKRIYVEGEVMTDCPAGSYEMTLHLGTQKQTLDLGGFALLNLGQNIDESRLPYNAITYEGDAPDAPWRKAAQERIDQLRKANLTVIVQDKNGKPVPAAEVHIQMQRHAYGFGTFLEYDIADKTSASDKHRAWILKLFNRATTPLYWNDWGWANPKRRELFMKTAQWAQDHHLSTRGHVIVYPAFKFMPSSTLTLKNDPQRLRQVVLDHVKEVVLATKQFSFKEYDVTNELRNCKDLLAIIGKDAVPKWFQVAREYASPSTHMAINENNILGEAGNTQGQQENYEGWIQYLIDHGQAPDVIGMQGHFSTAVTPPETLLAILDRFAKFGKPIQITEFDINTRDEEGQARYLRDFLTAIFSHPSTEAFTVWGFWEKT
ncbi:MAG: endo-1,4-beta-xylanase, partial [Methylacidiphilales bacterium]|nr:endo-1,4-beta-xylanase [Candidatus Methylacidiphilales bacterium]